MAENFRVKIGECQTEIAPTNVGTLVEIESQDHLVLKVTGEMEIDNVRIHREQSKKFELNEVITSDKVI